MHSALIKGGVLISGVNSYACEKLSAKILDVRTYEELALYVCIYVTSHFLAKKISLHTTLMVVVFHLLVVVSVQGT